MRSSTPFPDVKRWSPAPLGGRRWRGICRAQLARWGVGQELILDLCDELKGRLEFKTSEKGSSFQFFHSGAHPDPLFRPARLAAGPLSIAGQPRRPQDLCSGDADALRERLHELRALFPKGSPRGRERWKLKA
jgi:hypothetical protein